MQKRILSLVLALTLMVAAFIKEVRKGWMIRNDKGEVESFEGYQRKEEYVQLDIPEVSEKSAEPAAEIVEDK